jgi:hypothetical protein
MSIRTSPSNSLSTHTSYSNLNSNKNKIIKLQEEFKKIITIPKADKKMIVDLISPHLDSNIRWENNVQKFGDKVTDLQKVIMKILIKCQETDSRIVIINNLIEIFGSENEKFITKYINNCQDSLDTLYVQFFKHDWDKIEDTETFSSLAYKNKNFREHIAKYFGINIQDVFKLLPGKTNNHEKAKSAYYREQTLETNNGLVSSAGRDSTRKELEYDDSTSTSTNTIYVTSQSKSSTFNEDDHSSTYHDSTSSIISRWPESFVNDSKIPQVKLRAKYGYQTEIDDFRRDLKQLIKKIKLKIKVDRGFKLKIDNYREYTTLLDYSMTDCYDIDKFRIAKLAKHNLLKFIKESKVNLDSSLRGTSSSSSSISDYSFDNLEDDGCDFVWFDQEPSLTPSEEVLPSSNKTSVGSQESMAFSSVPDDVSVAEVFSLSEGIYTDNELLYSTDDDNEESSIVDFDVNNENLEELLPNSNTTSVGSEESGIFLSVSDEYCDAEVSMSENRHTDDELTDYEYNNEFEKHGANKYIEKGMRNSLRRISSAKVKNNTKDNESDTYSDESFDSGDSDEFQNFLSSLYDEPTENKQNKVPPHNHIMPTKGLADLTRHRELVRRTQPRSKAVFKNTNN